MVNLDTELIEVTVARGRLDALDTRLVELIGARLRLPQRDRAFLQTRVQRMAELGMDSQFAERFFRSLVEEGLKSQFDTPLNPRESEEAAVRLEEVDAQLIALIDERMEVSIGLTRAKYRDKSPIVHPVREEEVLQKWADRAQAVVVDPDFARMICRTLMDEGTRFQRELWQIGPLKLRILTGVRPTGPLHLGHYAGTLRSWLEFQKQYDCYFLIADYQALGDFSGSVSLIRDSVFQVALDWLAIGLDPNTTSFVVQSEIPETAELTQLLSVIMPLNRYERNPTLKEERQKLEAEKKPVTVGFWSYVASQVADILLPKANLVPVGEDQKPHIAEARAVARDFNRLYGRGENIFPVPDMYFGAVPRLVGLDGDAKMSKSRGNTIDLRDAPATVEKLVMTMYTDPTRRTASDPGHIKGNPVFDYHDAFNPDKDEVADLKDRYVRGQVGDVEVKKKLARAINAMLDPIRERRAWYEERPRLVRDALLEGTAREKAIAVETMKEVKEAMGITNYLAELIKS